MLVFPYTTDTPYEQLAEESCQRWRDVCPDVPCVLAPYTNLGDWLRNTLGMVIAFEDAAQVYDPDAAILMGADVFPGKGAEDAVRKLLSLDQDVATELRPNQPRFQTINSGVATFNLRTEFGALALSQWARYAELALNNWDELKDLHLKHCPDQVALLDVLEVLERYGLKWLRLPEWTNARHGNNPEGPFQHPPASKKFRSIIDGGAQMS